MATTHPQKIEIFEQYRPLLFSIAYRMLGSVMEAEDIVQEAYLRYEAVPDETIRSPKALLSTITTRLCLDQLKSARSQRESYYGPWLPEPLLTGEMVEPFSQNQEMISTAFLVLLETLSPLERAVFLLREVFDYSYAEIAEMVDKSEANCRQLYHRAKQYLLERRSRFKPIPAEQRQLVSSFMQAVQAGDLESLTHLLTEDVTVTADGGGKVHAAARPVVGRDHVLRLLVGSARKAQDIQLQIAEVNGGLAVLIWQAGRLISVATLAGDGQRIGEMNFVWNPEKLQHLQGVS
jgi:RNA polymerase sigma-70 factor (ECF subfamily)